jgi:hypothetical protein
MTAADSLKRALQKIQWKQNVDAFLQNASDLEALGNAAHLISAWCAALASAESTNPAVSFLAEAQVECHYVAALIPLALYKPAAASMRTAFESILYYSYFRTHPAELESLVRNAEYYVSKADILDFHKVHTANFKARQEAWGLISRINSWYSRTSAIIHGQVPGKWVSHRSLGDLAPVDATRLEAQKEFGVAAELINHFLLCTIDSERWSTIGKDMRQTSLKGVPGQMKAHLGLSIL